MLILVGVTINVALNGGLFEKAKEATTKTQREVEREQLIAVMLRGYSNSGRFDIENVKNELPAGVKWCEENTTTYSNASNTLENGPKDGWVITENNNKFYIDENGSVLDTKPQSQPVVPEEPEDPQASEPFDPDTWYNVTFSTIDTDVIDSMMDTRGLNNDVDYKAYFVDENSQAIAFNIQRASIPGGYSYGVGLTYLSTSVSYTYNRTENEWVNINDATDTKATIELTKVKLIPGETVGGNVINDEDLPNFMSKEEWSE